MVDYSKWKDIEISDDEDETHPNIDTSSLFRWRHQARLERMEAMEKEKQEFQAKKQSYAARLRDIKERISKKDGDLDSLQKELEKLQVEGKEIEKHEEDLRKKENKTPWNVDTISKPGFEKTIINKKDPVKQAEQLSEEEKDKRSKEFMKENEKLIKQYGMLRRYEDSKNLLKANPHLVSDDTANYLVLWCISLEMEKKHDLMAHVAHQCICMQYILELGKQLEVDPRGCIGAFFSKIQNCVVDYKQQFDNEVEEFKKRIQKRAEEKYQEALAEAEEEEERERQARLGPGGLDPLEVFEGLPEDLKKCFETRDIQLLHETLAKMSEEDARHYMKQCVDSGLWVPDAKNAEKSGEAGTEGDASKEQGSFKAEKETAGDVD